MKDKILAALSQADDFLSGQELSEMLGVSRTAVWKAIGKLKEEGYEIEAVTNKGYRLVAVPDADLLNAYEIERRLTTKWVGHTLYYEKKTGSTNDDVMQLSNEGAEEGTLVVSSQQTKGKGRRGRSWSSPAGGNVYMSLLLRPKIAPDLAPMSTLIMALSVYDALKSYAKGREDVVFGIKWPNDLVVSVKGQPYRKFVGILTEMRMEDTQIKDVTIGIGLNLNKGPETEGLEDKATTLSVALGQEINRAEITAMCWNCFEPNYEEFMQAKSIKPLKDRYNAALVNRGRKVLVLDPKGEYTGVAQGIEDTGELTVIRDDNGQQERIGTGEISVRGVMGYV